jgi:hypothetical protein
MKILMKRSIEKIKLTKIEILNPENAKKFSGEKKTSSYGILKPFALTNTKSKHHIKQYPIKLILKRSKIQIFFL